MLIWLGLFVFILFFECCPLSLATDSAVLQNGIKSYNQKNYVDAIGNLRFYLKHNPTDAVAHYYLANSLERIGYGPDSLKEYKTALSYSKSPQLWNYCRLAIEATMPKELPQVNIRAGDDLNWAGNAEDPGSFLMQANLDRPRVGAGTTFGAQDPTLRKTLARVQAQAEDRLMNGSNPIEEARRIQERLDRDTQVVQRDRDNQIQYLMDNPFMSNKKVIPRTAEMQQVTMAAEQRIADLSATAHQQLEASRSNTDSRARQFQDQVQDLKDSIVESAQFPARNNIHLQPFGTDLYTRNFGGGSVAKSPKVQSPNELLASPERLILEAHSRPGQTISRTVHNPMQNEAQKSARHSQTPVANLKVHGELVH